MKIKNFRGDIYEVDKNTTMDKLWKVYDDNGVSYGDHQRIQELMEEKETLGGLDK